MGAAMIFACDFPGCHVTERQDKRESGKLSLSNWMIFEAAWLSYERFAFCPEHGKAIRHQHDANQEAWHAIP